MTTPTGQEATASSRLPSIAQRLVGDVRVVVMRDRARLEGEFEAHVAEAVAMAPSVRVVLVVQLAGEEVLDATERKQLFNAGLFKVPSAVLMDGTFGRLVLTALRWMGASQAYGFAHDEFDKACDVLQIPNGRRSEIASTITELKAKLTKDAVAERLERVRRQSTRDADGPSKI